MKNKVIWLMFVVLVVFSLLLVSCGAKTTPTTTSTATSVTSIKTTPVTTSTTTTATAQTTKTGNWWDKLGAPKYGGTITFRTTNDIDSWDPYYINSGQSMLNIFTDTLAGPAWKIDRDVWDFKINYVPLEYYSGRLAESWEVPDWSTYIFHIRKGIRWQDIPPVNGRELTAYDIEYVFHRELGLGSGFTKANPYVTAQELPIISVTATDKYTVVFKLNAPSVDVLDNLLQTNTRNHLVAREAIEKWGNVGDWKRAIGVGPFIVSDYVSGSSLTVVKNPNYYGYDERHPENRLPYADVLKVLIIPDDATSYAALRTGKIDLIGSVRLQQAQSIARTNPELLQVQIPSNGLSLDLRNDTSPFTDIRVKTALQMALDLNTIAKTYYGGLVDGTPYCLAGSSLKGFYVPFNDWPKQLQDEYTYNPAGAKKLLADAGYPKGFKTNTAAATNQDLDLLQIIKAFLLDIGVDLEIRTMDPVSFSALKSAKKQDQMVVGECALPWPPSRFLARGYSKSATNWTFNNDPVYDKMYEKFMSSFDDTERKQLSREMDMYAVTKHWRIVFLPTVSTSFYQSWFKGYTGENQTPGMGGFGFTAARVWIDRK